MAYRQAYDGEPFILHSIHYIRCCSCSLVHKIKLRKISPRRYEMTAWPEVKMTRAGRRRKRFKNLRVAKGAI
jgi:hypothetical protein